MKTNVVRLFPKKKPRVRRAKPRKPHKPSVTVTKRHASFEVLDDNGRWMTVPVTSVSKTEDHGMVSVRMVPPKPRHL
jgi:hypothetical protein